MDPVRNPRLVIIGGAIGAYTQNPEDHPIAAIAGMGLGAYVGNEIEIIRHSFPRGNSNSIMTNTIFDKIGVDLSRLNESPENIASTRQTDEIARSSRKNAARTVATAHAIARREVGAAYPKAAFREVEKELYKKTYMQSISLSWRKVGDTGVSTSSIGTMREYRYVSSGPISDGIINGRDNFNRLMKKSIEASKDKISKGKRFDKSFPIQVVAGEIKEKEIAESIQVLEPLFKNSADQVKEAAVKNRADEILKEYKSAVAENFKAISGKEVGAVVPDSTLDKILFSVDNLPSNLGPSMPLEQEIARLNISSRDAAILRQSINPENINIDEINGKTTLSAGFTKLNRDDVSHLKVSNFSSTGGNAIEITNAEIRENKIDRLSAQFKSRVWNEVEAKRVASNIVDNSTGTIHITSNNKIRFSDGPGSAPVEFDIPEMKNGNFVIKDNASVRIGNTHNPFMNMEAGDKLPDGLKLSYTMYDHTSGTHGIGTTEIMNGDVKFSRFSDIEQAIIMSKAEGINIHKAAKKIKDGQRWIQNRNSESVGELIEYSHDVYTDVSTQYTRAQDGSIRVAAPTHNEYTDMLSRVGDEHTRRGMLNPVSSFRHSDDLRINLAELNGASSYTIEDISKRKIDAAIIQVPERGSNKIGRGTLPIGNTGDVLHSALNLLRQEGVDTRNLHGAHLVSLETVDDAYNASPRSFFTSTAVGDGLGIATRDLVSAEPFTISLGNIDDGIVLSKSASDFLHQKIDEPDAKRVFRPGEIIANTKGGESSVSLPKHYDRLELSDIVISNDELVLVGKGETGNAKNGSMVKLYGLKTNVEKRTDYEEIGKFIDRLEANSHIVQTSTGGWKLEDGFKKVAAVSIAAGGFSRNWRTLQDIESASDRDVILRLRELVYNKGKAFATSAASGTKGSTIKLTETKNIPRVAAMLSRMDPSITTGKFNQIQEEFSRFAHSYFKANGVDFSLGMDAALNAIDSIDRGRPDLIVRKDESHIGHEIGTVYRQFQEIDALRKTSGGGLSTYNKAVSTSLSLLRPYISEDVTDNLGNVRNVLISDIPGRQISEIEKSILETYNEIQSGAQRIKEKLNTSKKGSKTYKKAIAETRSPAAYANMVSKVLGVVFGVNALNSGKESQVILGSALKLIENPKNEKHFHEGTIRTLSDLFIDVDGQSVKIADGFSTATKIPGTKKLASNEANSIARGLQRFTAINEAYGAGLISSEEAFEIISKDISTLARPLMTANSKSNLTAGAVVTTQLGNAIITGEKKQSSLSWMGVQQLHSLGFSNEEIAKFAEQNRGAAYQLKGLGKEKLVDGQSFTGLHSQGGSYDKRYADIFIKNAFSDDRENFIKEYNALNGNILNTQDGHVYISLEEVEGEKLGRKSIAIPIHDSSRTGIIRQDGKNITHEIERKKQSLLYHMSGYISERESGGNNLELMKSNYLEALREYNQYEKEASKSVSKAASKVIFKSGVSATAVETVESENAIIRSMAHKFDPSAHPTGELPVFLNKGAAEGMLGDRKFRLEQAQINGHNVEDIYKIMVENESGEFVPFKGFVGRDPQSGPLNMRGSTFYLSKRMSEDGIRIAMDRENLSLMSGDLDGDKLIIGGIHPEDVSDFDEIYKKVHRVEAFQVGAVTENKEMLALMYKKLSDIRNVQGQASDIQYRHVPNKAGDIQSGSRYSFHNAQGIALSQQRKRDAAAATEIQQMVYESINREVKDRKEKIAKSGIPMDQIQKQVAELEERRLLALASTNALQETIIKAVKNKDGAGSTAEVLVNVMKERERLHRFKSGNYSNVADMIVDHMRNTYMPDEDVIPDRIRGAFDDVISLIGDSVRTHGRAVSDDNNRMVGSVFSRKDSLSAASEYVVSDIPEAQGPAPNSSKSSVHPPHIQTAGTSSGSAQNTKIGASAAASTPLPDININSKIPDANEIFGTIYETIKHNKKPLLLGGLGLGAISMTLGAEAPDLKSPALMAPMARSNTTLPPLEENKQYIREYDNFGVDSGSITVAGYRVDSYSNERFKQGLRGLYQGDSAARHNVTFRDQRY